MVKDRENLFVTLVIVIGAILLAFFNPEAMVIIVFFGFFCFLIKYLSEKK